jgi:hypothetical protein
MKSLRKAAINRKCISWTTKPRLSLRELLPNTTLPTNWYHHMCIAATRPSAPYAPTKIICWHVWRHVILSFLSPNGTASYFKPNLRSIYFDPPASTRTCLRTLICTATLISTKPHWRLQVPRSSCISSPTNERHGHTTAKKDGM